MTRGPIFQKNNIIFGRGYSEAYQKEREIGQAPRIVIDLCLIKEVKSIDLQEQYPHGHILDLLRQDKNDGLYFIDYLKPLTLFNNVEKMKTEREEIKKIVKDKLIKYCDDQKIIRKYNWLSNYILLTESYYEERPKS